MFAGFYNILIRIGTFLQPFLLLAIRLYWGYALFQAGIGKFANHPTVVQFFQSINIPYAEANAYLVAFFEMVGGLCLFFGFASRLMCVPLIVILVAAYMTAHYDAVANIVHDPEAFISQSPFLFLETCLIVFSFGPGAFSIDAILKKIHDKKAEKK